MSQDPDIQKSIRNMICKLACFHMSCWLTGYMKVMGHASLFMIYCEGYFLSLALVYFFIFFFAHSAINEPLHPFNSLMSFQPFLCIFFRRFFFNCPNCQIRTGKNQLNQASSNIFALCLHVQCEWRWTCL